MITCSREHVLAEKCDFWVILGSIRRIGKSDTAYWSIRRIGAFKYGFWKISASIRRIGKSDTAYRSAARLMQTCFLRISQTVMNWKSRHLSLDSYWILYHIFELPKGERWLIFSVCKKSARVASGLTQNCAPLHRFHHITSTSLPFTQIWSIKLRFCEIP